MSSFGRATTVVARRVSALDVPLAVFVACMRLASRSQRAARMMLTGPTRLVVVTGGPGAGKSAVLEVARQRYRGRAVVLPEAASILFGGGFPRRAEEPWQRAAQRGIYHVQRQLERAALETTKDEVILCDRGTLDGLAYWPEGDDGLLVDVGSTRSAELARYAVVVHLRPPAESAFNHQNPLRTENFHQALALDAVVEQAWSSHPMRHFVASTEDFLGKVHDAIEVLDGIIL